MIRLKNITAGYAKGQAVFRDLSVDIPTDRRIAILGSQGSGKTTLINLISGITEPERGNIQRDVRVSFPAGYQRGFRLVNSARQNVMFAAKIYGADAEEVFDFVRTVTDLGDEMDRPMRDLSAQDRISLSYALTYAIPFDVYLFENTVAQGHPEFRERCIAMFEERTRTCGAIVATRFARIASQHCDCALLIREGRLDFFEDLGEALDLSASDGTAAPSLGMAVG